jgi:hypothetical protein
MIRRAESTEEDPIYTCTMDEDAAALVGLPGTSPWTGRCLAASSGRAGAWTWRTEACAVKVSGGVHVGAGRRLEESRFADGDVVANRSCLT